MGSPEEEVEHLVRKWLDRQGFFVKRKKREGIDIEAHKDGQLWIVEVKGDQGENNWRNTFQRGLGQLVIARCRHPEATKVSLALTATWQYVPLAKEYQDVLKYLDASVIWVRGQDDPCLDDPASPSFPSVSAKGKRPGRLHRIIINGEFHEVDKWTGERLRNLVFSSDVPALQELFNDKEQNVRQATVAALAEIASKKKG